MKTYIIENYDQDLTTNHTTMKPVRLLSKVKSFVIYGFNFFDKPSVADPDTRRAKETKFSNMVRDFQNIHFHELMTQINECHRRFGRPFDAECIVVKTGVTGFEKYYYKVDEKVLDESVMFYLAMTFSTKNLELFRNNFIRAYELAEFQDS